MTDLCYVTSLQSHTQASSLPHQPYQWIHINATYDPERLGQAKRYTHKTSIVSSSPWRKSHAVQLVKLLGA